MNRLVAGVAAGVALTAYGVSLFLGWAVMDGTSRGFFEVTGNSSAISAFLSVLYLVATLVSLGLSGAALFTPRPKHRWYAVGAGIVALADLGFVCALWYRIGRADTIDPATGVYVAGLAALATLVVAGFATSGYPHGGDRYDG
ncbi:MAG: hypothetical protein ACRDTU_03390 [Micromonosporaceae bacterium]